MSLRDKMDTDTSKLQKNLLESTPNRDLRRRLQDLSQNLKQGRVSKNDNHKTCIYETEIKLCYGKCSKISNTFLLLFSIK